MVKEEVIENQDLFVCGSCSRSFTLLDHFISHKNGCKKIENQIDENFIKNEVKEEEDPLENLEFDQEAESDHIFVKSIEITENHFNDGDSLQKDFVCEICEAKFEDGENLQNHKLAWKS